MTDSLGVSFDVGDWVTYPGRRSSSCWWNVGQVAGSQEVEQYGRRVTYLKVRKWDGKKLAAPRNVKSPAIKIAPTPAMVAAQ